MSLHLLLPSLLVLTVSGSAIGASSRVDINPLEIKVDTKLHSAHHKQLSDYTQQLALKLSDSMTSQYVSHIAVASFVDFDHTLHHTNPLGNQLAQELLGDLQRFGYSTVEHKLTPYIEVNQGGDFVLSRDSKALAKNIGIDHILTGTLVYRQNGVVVHARVVGTQDQVVKASARQFIPYFVISELVSNG
ncbi:FlgO family outer membrane protein [Pseudoalteromonas sp. YIC-656]|uniref:FlgO family outer membrane protein n=1 Tax=Pseudoalteromonas pernae TaxID=3118054 RepID=UPI003241F876